MLLFDDSKKLEKALGEEAAAVIVHVFEKMNEDNKRELATKADLENGLLALRSELAATKADLENSLMALRSEMREMMKEMEIRLTLRLGGMLAASVAVVAALVKLL